MTTKSTGLCVPVLVLIGLTRLAAAQDREPDALYLTGQVNAGAAFSGGGGEAEWLHWVSPRTSLIVGGTTTSIGNLSWTYGSVGGFSRRSAVMLSGRVSMGSGRQSADTFAYARYIGSVTLPVGRRVYAEAEGQHARMLKTGTTVVKIGGLYADPRGVSLRLAHYSTFSLASHRQSVSGAADMSIGRVRLFGGATATIRATGPVEASAIELQTHISRGFWVGSSVDTRQTQLISALEVVPHPAGGMSRVTVTLRLPLSSRASSEVFR